MCLKYSYYDIYDLYVKIIILLFIDIVINFKKMKIFVNKK